MEKFYKRIGVLAMLLFSATLAFAQTTISGTVKDGAGEPLPGVSILVKGKVIGTTTDAAGQFNLKVNQAPPLTLVFSYVGFQPQEIEVTSATTADLGISMEEQTILGQEIVISASRMEESILKAPVSIEKMDILAVQNTPSESYYKGLINLKGLDMTQSSINFQIINARGFNSTGNTRFVQLTDGMDTQAPALNFPIGNLNGPSELDVESVEFLPGASSALYGPNAFNGILLVNSKSPFEFQGVSAFVKLGANHFNDGPDGPDGPKPMYEASLRYAKSFNNKFAFKVNFSYSAATDWYATNYTDKNPERKPEGFTSNIGADYVNQFGDDAAVNISLLALDPGFQAAAESYGLEDYLGDIPNAVVARTPYKEKDIVDYNAKNLKFGGSLHYRLNDKVEAIYALNYGGGTSVYTGAQRYALKNFSITQHKVEFRGDNFFLRGYATLENSGDSYIADLVAVQVNKEWSDNALTTSDGNSDWFATYNLTYMGGIAQALGQAGLDPGQSELLPPSVLETIHGAARTAADANRYAPGSAEFKTAVNKYKGATIPNGGGKFDDKSALYHAQGQYDFKNEIKFIDLLAGASYRLYQLNSNGTIFADGEGNDITISEYGAYLQASKTFGPLRLIGSARYDKNENFDGRVTPRIAGVLSVTDNHNIRASFQTGFRNPSTQAQHIDLNAISAQLVGGLQQYADKYQITYNTYTMASVTEYTRRVLNAGTSAAVVDPANIAVLERFSTFNPVKPESIETFEVGYKGLLANQKLMIDASYYYNQYTDFELQVRVRRAAGDVSVNAANASSLLNGDNTNTFQIYTNATDKVTSQGATFGVTYSLPRNFSISSNYNWNTLNKGDNIDGAIFSFNTPEHKVNFTFANRKLTDRLGFAVTWRWQEEFLWESSFANGTVPSYNTLDAQVSYRVPSMKSIIKLGGSNLINNYYIMSYGSPAVGGIYYISVTFDELFK